MQLCIPRTIGNFQNNDEGQKVDIGYCGREGEILNMPDPEAFEQTHNDALLEMDAEPIEEDPEEDLEEDLMEGQGNNLVENELLVKM